MHIPGFKVLVDAPPFEEGHHGAPMHEDTRLFRYHGEDYCQDYMMISFLTGQVQWGNANLIERNVLDLIPSLEDGQIARSIRLHDYLNELNEYSPLEGRLDVG